MNEPKVRSSDIINVFKKCGTCSQTFGHLLNREFGYHKDAEVRALDPLAGGVMHQGRQCGMLWGAALAIGAEAFRKYEDKEEAMVVAVRATQLVMASFSNRTGTVNCKEVIGIDLSKITGLIKFMVKTTLQGTKNNTCYNLAEQWVPEAIQSATEGLAEEEPKERNRKCMNCASEVVRKMGASDEEMTMVAGFAGGMGLCGNACGALSAAIWMKTLQWCKKHPGKNPPYFNNKPAKKILKAFYRETDSEILCSKITAQRFENLEEHSDFVQRGGCKKLIMRLAKI